MKTIEEMAREAGIDCQELSGDAVERFAALVRNQALEDAAAAVDSEASEMARMRWRSEFDQSRHIAIALRALIRESSATK